MPLASQKQHRFCPGCVGRPAIANASANGRSTRASGHAHGHTIKPATYGVALPNGICPASPHQNPRTDALLKIDVDPKSKTFGEVLASHRGTSDSYPAPQDVDSPTCQTDLQWPVGRFTCAQLDYNFLASPNLFGDGKGRRLLGEIDRVDPSPQLDADPDGRGRGRQRRGRDRRCR